MLNVFALAVLLNNHLWILLNWEHSGEGLSMYCKTSLRKLRKEKTPKSLLNLWCLVTECRHLAYNSQHYRNEPCEHRASRYHCFCLVTKLCLTLCNSMDYSPWNFPGKNTGVDCYFLLQGIFLTQRSNLHLASPALADGFFTREPPVDSLPGKPTGTITTDQMQNSHHLFSLNALFPFAFAFYFCTANHNKFIS